MRQHGSKYSTPRHPNPDSDPDQTTWVYTFVVRRPKRVFRDGVPLVHPL